MIHGTMILAASGDGGGGGGAALFFGVGLAALLLLALPTAVVVRLRFRITERAAVILAEKPWLCRLLGAADVLLFLLVASAGEAHPAFGIVAILLAVLLTLALLVGLGAAAIGLGGRLREDPDRAAGAGAFALGWLLLAGIPLFPILGPLYFLWFAAGGIGAAILALKSP